MTTQPKLNHILTRTDKPHDYIENNRLFELELIDFEIKNLFDEKPHIDSCKFTNCTFIDSLTSADLVDTVFENCDLSNISFEEACFHRVSFIRCRLTGCDFSKSLLVDVLLSGCKANYGNWSFSKTKDCSLLNTDFTEASFVAVNFKSTLFDQCVLDSSEFYNTKLKNIDFSSSSIEGIGISSDSIQGLTVNSYQAATLAKILGLIIKS